MNQLYENHTETVNLLLCLQVGACPDHFPLFRHVRTLNFPNRMNPGLQLYVAVEPTLVPVRTTFPFSGPSR